MLRNSDARVTFSQRMMSFDTLPRLYEPWRLRTFGSLFLALQLQTPYYIRS